MYVAIFFYPWSILNIQRLILFHENAAITKKKKEIPNIIEYNNNFYYL